MSSLNMIINDARACVLKLDQVLYTHDDDDDDVFFLFSHLKSHIHTRFRFICPKGRILYLVANFTHTHTLNIHTSLSFV